MLMKKLISLSLVALMVLALSACGQADIPENQNADFPADYLSDKSVLIISEKSDIDENTVKEHYKSGGIILVKNWKLASEIQDMIATTMTTDFSEKDSAIIFYLTADGVPGISTIGGNSSDLDRDIDEMIDEAKSKQ